MRVCEYCKQEIKGNFVIFQAMNESMTNRSQIVQTCMEHVVPWAMRHVHWWIQITKKDKA